MEIDGRPCLQSGDSPLLISVPHAGTGVPPEVFERFSGRARQLPDTDWYVDRLYGWAPSMGAGMLITPISRFVIDMNRPPDDAPLYDFSGSGLCIGLVPATTFAGEPVYQQGCEPGTQEKRQRVEKYWNPYHQCLQAELTRVRNRFGHAVLLDAHSIRSTAPLLFKGRLPDLNLGSNDGRSAAPELLAATAAVLGEKGFSLVIDGRFKGGYITRHYGVPANGVHALQLEKAQAAYMKEDRPHWSAALARPLQSVLQRLVQTLIDWKPDSNEP